MMLRSLILPAILLASQAIALNVTYAYVPGFFAQDDPNADPEVIGALPDRFGLLDSSPGHWRKFELSVKALDWEGGYKSSIKVFFLGRHGEAIHNVAEAKYGKPAWNDYWSKLDGDGTLVWGPDALLTASGVQRAESVHNKWLDEIQSGIPVPTVFYSSPLTRTLRTLEITWTGITLPYNSDRSHLHACHKVVVDENCRETFGLHTCDKRHPKSWIAEEFPLYTFNKGFTEEDELWTPDNRETAEHIHARARSVLDDIWHEYPVDTYVSITLHGGIIQALLNVVGRGPYGLHGLPTGGVLPIVIRRTVS